MKDVKIGGTGFTGSRSFRIMRMDALSVDEAVKVLETAKQLGINFIVPDIRQR